MRRLLLLEDGDRAVRVHCDKTGGLQLLDHLVRSVVVPSEHLDFGDLGFEGGESGKFGLEVGLFRCFFGLGGLDFLHGATTHVSLLQHIDAAALDHC